MTVLCELEILGEELTLDKGIITLIECESISLSKTDAATYV
jgi:hypothetical protein